MLKYLNLTNAKKGSILESNDLNYLVVYRVTTTVSYVINLYTICLASCVFSILDSLNVDYAMVGEGV